jgi:hypothetical protein
MELFVPDVRERVDMVLNIVLVGNKGEKPFIKGLENENMKAEEKNGLNLLLSSLYDWMRKVKESSGNESGTQISMESDGEIG